MDASRQADRKVFAREPGRVEECLRRKRGPAETVCMRKVIGQKPWSEEEWGGEGEARGEGWEYRIRSFKVTALGGLDASSHISSSAAVYHSCKLSLSDGGGEGRGGDESPAALPLVKFESHDWTW